ncbi:carboxypeptidase-like regulatory domain-containing protein [Winogradskyella forsetii]|nr:carboxypeptidase-like regulatory domain-containing protein [Winogradskyella forsetii]
MKTNTIILFLIILSLFGCSADIENITVTGKIVDESNGSPIINAEVVILCWYEHSFEEASFEKKTALTDNEGFFRVNFDKGHKIDIASKAKNYLPNRSYNDLTENKLELTLKLDKQQNNPTLVKLLSTEKGFYQGQNDYPFLRVRVYDNDNVLNFENQETYGFDHESLIMSLDTINSDFWFKQIRKDNPPSVIKTNPQGGIKPIFENEISSSVLYEQNIAPTKGYKTEYILTGNEEGFFVLCRDGKTYGKLIFENSTIDIGKPDGNGGYYKEFGKNFNWIHQENGSTNLTYPNSEIDLENFLVDYRLR